MPPRTASASVTTGLKWAPDTGPKARVRATSPPAEAGLVGRDLGAAPDFHAQVVQAGLGVGVLEEHELQRWIGDGEVGVAGLALVGLGCEQLRVEGDRGVDVRDVEGELYTGHGTL